MELKNLEESILKFWKEKKIFEKSVNQRSKLKRYVFFEGPPFPNAPPGVHHAIGRSFKDLFSRYKTMRGYRVERRAGWDTHGLPIELQVEKKLGLKSKKEIEKYGIDKFNKECREMVWGFKNIWDDFTDKIGFWVDKQNAYITYTPEYIESVWWVFSEIAKKGLVKKDFKVVPYCPRCGTPLSSHEVVQGYDTVTENSVYLKFKLKPGQKIKADFILSWTTTPWTLPGNVALAVGEEIEYVIAGDENEKFIIAKDRKQQVLGEVTVFEHIKGKDLVGLEYESLFEVKNLKSENSYKVYPADFVNTEEGTGVVHTAVMYGEDDFNLGTKTGLPKFHTVDTEGKFIKGLGYSLDGLAVKSKEAEEKLISHLKQNNFLLKEENYTHDYPFCWRCGTALLYYAIDSWFITVSKIKDKLIKNNRKVNWYPEYLKEGRFGQWLRELKDWAISRDRYWGTPLPIWECEKCEEKMFIGSLEELEKHRYQKPNRYVLLRHGERDDAEKMVESSLVTDSVHITKKGREQVRQAAAEIKSRFKKVDLIFSSDFTRTKETAEILAKSFNVDINYDVRLRELSAGIYSGRPLNEYHSLFSSELERFEKTPAGAENLEDLRKRVFEFIKETDKKYEDKNIIIISHGDPLWILAGILDNLSNEQMVAVDGKNYLPVGRWRDASFKNYPYAEGGYLNIHRPYVDELKLKCQKCGSKSKRVSEVMDVWFDSGSMPYAQWHYPFENKLNFKLNFPADFIAEGIDQTRGWFYTLLAISSLLGLGPAYKNVISYGHILDEKGQKMSKSKGNVVDPFDLIEKYGADSVRWYFFTINPAGEPKKFAFKDVEERMKGMIRVMLNSLRFLQLYQEQKNKDFDFKNLDLLDKWLLSKLHGLINEVTSELESYDANSASRKIDNFIINDLSNWWIRRSRDSFSAFVKTSADKQHSENKKKFLGYILQEISKLLAPFTPFLADFVYRGIGPDKESVHLEDWPKANKKFINQELESQMELIRRAVTLGLAKRKDANIKVRQPLASFQTTVIAGVIIPNELLDLVKDELNVKEVGQKEDKLDTKITPALRQEGMIREVMRQIQDLRKEAQYKFDRLVYGYWHTDNPELKRAVENYLPQIREKTYLKEFDAKDPQTRHILDVEKELEIEKDILLWLGLKE